LLSAAKRRLTIARSFNCGICGHNGIKSREGRPDSPAQFSTDPLGLEIILLSNPQLKLRAIFKRTSGASIPFFKRGHKNGARFSRAEFGLAKARGKIETNRPLRVRG
jgi:hypothetical protein